MTVFERRGEVRAAVRRALGPARRREMFAASCDVGAGAVVLEAARFRSILAADNLDATADEVCVALRQLAVLLHPESPAAREMVPTDDKPAAPVEDDPADENGEAHQETSDPGTEPCESEVEATVPKPVHRADPGSATAVRARIRERVREEVRPRGGGGVRAAGKAKARRAVEQLLDDDEQMLARFCRAAESGVASLREMVPATRAALTRRGHRFADPRRELEETGDALFDVAEELLPDSPAAVRGRLKERVRARPTDRDPSVAETVEALVAHAYAWWDLWLVAAGEGHAALYRMADCVRDELAGRGHPPDRAEVEDALWSLARELLPQSPAAEWDADWSAALMSRAVRYVFVERLADAGVAYEDLDASALDEPSERIIDAYAAEDRTRYRAAVRSWVRSGLREIARAKAARDDPAA